MSTPAHIAPVMAGCVVLVTADRRSGDLAAAFERRGASIRHAPALSIVPSVDDEQLLADTRALLANPPGTLVVTTGVGFRGWIEAADSAGLAADLGAMLADVRIIARGPKAKGAIMAAGHTPDWVAESETSAEILEVLSSEGVAGHRIAVQQHGNGADGLDTELAARGADVASFVVYRWGPPPNMGLVEESVRACAQGEIDCVVFTSAPGAAAWLEVAQRLDVLRPLADRAGSAELLVAAVGPITAAPLEDVGIVPLIPDRSRLGALVRSVVAHYENSESAVQTIAGELIVRSTSASLNGSALTLTPGALAILRRLTLAEGGVLTRRELLAELPGDSTDEHAVEVAIARLREAAGDKRLIETVIKRGYRLALANR